MRRAILISLSLYLSNRTNANASCIEYILSNFKPDDEFIKISNSALIKEETTGDSAVTTYVAGGIAYALNANTNSIENAYDVNYDGNMQDRIVYYDSARGLFYLDNGFKKPYYGNVLMNIFKVDGVDIIYYKINKIIY